MRHANVVNELHQGIWMLAFGFPRVKTIVTKTIGVYGSALKASNTRDLGEHRVDVYLPLYGRKFQPRGFLAYLPFGWCKDVPDGSLG
jgi:hypothetical protein